MTAQTRAIAYDYEAGRWLHAGDRVQFRDEWGYWRTDETTGTLLSRNGWLVDIMTDDPGSTLKIHDLHTGTLHLADLTDERTAAQ